MFFWTLFPIGYVLDLIDASATVNWRNRCEPDEQEEADRRADNYSPAIPGSRPPT
jgi:hypothetical protein